MNQDINDPTRSKTEEKEDQAPTIRPSSLKSVEPKTEEPDCSGSKKQCSEKQKTNWPMRIEAACAVLLVFITGFYTYYARQQAGSAINAADAAKRSADALAKAQRAFVYFSTAINPTGVVPDAKTMKITNWEFSIPFGNSGETPTKHANVHCEIYTPKQALPDDFGYPDTVEVTKQLIVIGPKETTASGHLITTPDKVKAVQDGRGHLYLYGWCAYKDVFQNPGDVPHVTKFCFELDTWTGDPFFAREQLRQYGSFWVACRHHNCADDECRDEQYPSPPYHP